MIKDLLHVPIIYFLYLFYIYDLLIFFLDLIIWSMTNSFSALITWLDQWLTQLIDLINDLHIFYHT